MIKNCDNCGTPFEPFNSRSRFCSVRCRYTWGNAHKLVHKKACAGCGTSFETQGKNVKFCSLRCGTRYTTVVRSVVCCDCGVTFEHQGRGRRQHCDTCTPAWLSKTQMLWRAARDPNIKMGVGSGGNQWGENNTSWKPIEEHKSTRYRGHYRLRCFRHWPRKCVVDATHLGRIEVHHVNGNPDDFDLGNLVPMCTECHKEAHRKRWKTEAEFVSRTMELIPEAGRNKIAELSGEAEKPIRTEGYDVKRSQGQSIGTEETITSPRGCDTVLTR